VERSDATIGETDTLGFDHTKLSYRFQGRDFRLTDMEGELVTKILA
jgi:hypothetical protein